jgi:hypothetical protein
MASENKPVPSVVLGLVGLVVGGAAGYLLRGDGLTFEAVATRGASLHNPDPALLDAAQTSFLVMIGLALAGAVAGLIAARQPRINFRIKKPQDMGAAVLFLLIGIAGLWFGRNYAVGTAARMGPGYFPMMLSWMLIVFGIIVGAGSFVLEGEPISPGKARSTLLILAAILVFGLLVESAGLAIATIAVIIVSAIATPEAKWKEYVPLSLVMAVGCVLVFVYLLRQAIPPFPELSDWF